MLCASQSFEQQHHGDGHYEDDHDDEDQDCTSERDLNEMVDELFNARKGNEYPGQLTKKRRIRLTPE